MKYGKHHFSPSLHNEVRCDLCGEHLVDSQHIQVQPPKPVKSKAQKPWKGCYVQPGAHVG
ncbi:hypothetical protein FX983_02844 [Pseudomonas frederiksbergensis]|uniref:Uncharacterized protein n=1 Tax=Pseudomonas frederiksbergensis TaxID=104087 RepID=A0A6L5C3X4_9PSED|nr:hypothetical protein FX984_00603 [Pseudomonas marginalis]KAF2394862.1 hypothetical protein FX983_02844 [Pseudomonas frederiksbergensis]